jgi:hypothetical protein
MLGSIREGSRSAAMSVMISDQSVAVHETFDVGMYFEYDAHKEAFVDNQGNVVTEQFMIHPLYKDGWREWTAEDDHKFAELCAREDALREESNLGNYKIEKIDFECFTINSSVFFLGSSNKAERLQILKRRYSNGESDNSLEYFVKYQSGGTGWIRATSVFATKKDLAASVVS